MQKKDIIIIIIIIIKSIPSSPIPSSSNVQTLKTYNHNELPLPK